MHQLLFILRNRVCTLYKLYSFLRLHVQLFIHWPQELTAAATTSLSRHLTIHKFDGAPKAHVYTVHNLQISRDTLAENTKILRVINDAYRLQILEALLIHQRNPSLNKAAHWYVENPEIYLYNAQAAKHRTQEDPANLTNIYKVSRTTQLYHSPAALCRFPKFSSYYLYYRLL